MTASVLAAALKLAASGVRVFPCRKDKTPSTEHGFKDATRGEGIITDWWTRWPDALIGVPTGNVSGFDALDLDAKHKDAKDWWCENRRRLPHTRTHKTRSGGLHLLFQHNDTMRCSAGKIAPGVDTRSTAGYVIWWPASGLPILSDAALAPWPGWLLTEFRPKPRPCTTSSTIISVGGDGWLRGLVRLVANATEGQRNRILFWAACRGAEKVRDGRAVEGFVIDVLIAAATRAGLPTREAERTIKSGMNRQ